MEVGSFCHRVALTFYIREMAESIYNLTSDKCQTGTFASNGAYLYLSCISKSTNGGLGFSKMAASPVVPGHLPYFPPALSPLKSGAFFPKTLQNMYASQRKRGFLLGHATGARWTCPHKKTCFLGNNHPKRSHSESFHLLDSSIFLISVI